MARALPLHLMVLGASLDGMTLAKGALSNAETVQHIREAMEPVFGHGGAIIDVIYPVLGHPPMHPEPNFIAFVSFCLPSLFSFVCFSHDV